MKKTAFYEDHVALGGRMVSFAGFEMPVEFSGVKNEHIGVREKLGVFDVSHMGEIWVTGEKAADFVQYMTSNDIQKLSPGKIQYSCFPNGKGGVVDDLLVYMFSKDRYLLVVNASNLDKDWNWLNDNIIDGTTLNNLSDETSQLAVQGPLAIKALQKLTSVNLSDIPYYHFVEGELAGVKDMLISNTGYTGAGGFELYFKNEFGPEVLKAVLDAGEEYGIIPAGLASRDTLRLESGFCLYGNELSDETSPLEAGLGWITKFVDGNDFIDRPFLELQKAQGLKRKLVGFVLNDRGIPRHDYKILNLEGAEIGIVTSGTMSPLTSKAIGMGYVDVQYSKADTNIFIAVRNKKLSATVVRPPFYS